MQDGLKIDNPSGAQGLQLPVHVIGSYDLRFQFTRGEGAPNRGLSANLPVGTGRINVVFGQVNGQGVGIAGIDGRSAFHDSNPAADKKVEVLPDVKHDALVSVRLDGTRARITVALDDLPRVEWYGQQTDLRHPVRSQRIHAESVPVLAAWGNDVTFHHVHLRMVEGEATPLRGGELQRAADSLQPRQPPAPDKLDGYFHVACKGSFELLVNGRPVFANPGQTLFAGTSGRVTLKDGDVVAVRVNSKYVYRAIRLAFIDVNRKWLWSARREDFRVLKGVDPANVNAASIVASNQLPEFGRVDWDSATVDRWDSLIENDSSDWLWAGGKNEWAMFSAVVRPELFAPYKLVIPTHRSRWEPPRNAGVVINSPGDDAGPFLSADGKTLLFHSNRDGGGGDFDLYVSQRDSTDQAWQTPEPLGTSLNTAAADCFPRMSADGLTLLFCSTRDGGQGRRDMYQANRSSMDESWGEPTPMEALLNTEYDDGPAWLSPDGLSLWFSSDRPGGQGKYDIWRSQRASVSDSWDVPVNLRPINSSGDQRHPTASADGEVIVIDARWRSGFGQADLWS